MCVHRIKVVQVSRFGGVTLLVCRGSEYLIPQSRNGYAHDRTDDVEKTIWQINHGRHPQHCGLCHAARVPWHKHRGDCHAVLGGAAQQPTFKSLTVEYASEHIASKQYADVLVCHSQIKHQTTAHS